MRRPDPVRRWRTRPVQDDRGGVRQTPRHSRHDRNVRRDLHGTRSWGRIPCDDAVPLPDRAGQAGDGRGDRPVRRAGHLSASLMRPAGTFVHPFRTVSRTTPAARPQCETLMNGALRLATPFIRVRDDVLTFGQTLRSDGTYALVEVAGQERLPERDQAEAVTPALKAACAADAQVVATRHAAPHTLRFRNGQRDGDRAVHRPRSPRGRVRAVADPLRLRERLPAAPRAGGARSTPGCSRWRQPSCLPYGHRRRPPGPESWSDVRRGHGRLRTRRRPGTLAS